MAINSALYGKLKSDDGGIFSIIFLTFAMSFINYVIRHVSYCLEDIDFKKLMNFEFFFPQTAEEKLSRIRR